MDARFHMCGKPLSPSVYLPILEDLRALSKEDYDSFALLIHAAQFFKRIPEESMQMLDGFCNSDGVLDPTKSAVVIDGIGYDPNTEKYFVIETGETPDDTATCQWVDLRLVGPKEKLLPLMGYLMHVRCEFLPPTDGVMNLRVYDVKKLAAVRGRVRQIGFTVEQVIPTSMSGE